LKQLSFDTTIGHNLNPAMTSGRPIESLGRRLPDVVAVAAACVFVFLAAYRIELPGPYYDELHFVNAALGGPDNTFIHMRLGPLPVLQSPYMGTLKAWGYTPIFRLFGVSALTIRLPAILLAALTLLIFYCAMRDSVGPPWAAIAVSIMAVDPANLFPSRLDWGPTVLTHFFQAAILALWLSYRHKPKPWKLVLICICGGLGFFDRFNFVWLLSAFAIGICLCYPDSLKNLWVSTSRFTHWVVAIVALLALGITLSLILPLLLNAPPPTNAPITNVQLKWQGLLATLSGAAVAHFIFENSAGIIDFASFWLIIVDGFFVLACLLLPMSDAPARENRRNGLFCFLVGFLIFLQIIITPQAGGPHHYVMIFPWPFLAFVFLARSLYDHFRTKKLSPVVALPLVAAATCIFLVNIHNTMSYLSHFRSNPHYASVWSPEIYSLSRYVNEHGFEAKSIIYLDWGLHVPLHALAPSKLRRRMHDDWPTFLTLSQKDKEGQTAALNGIFPEGKSLAVTFARSKERFPETRQNFLAALAARPEFKSRLVKEFWFGGEKIYEVYEIDRPPPGA